MINWRARVVRVDKYLEFDWLVQVGKCRFGEQQMVRPTNCWAEKEEICLIERRDDCLLWNTNLSELTEIICCWINHWALYVASLSLTRVQVQIVFCEGLSRGIKAWNKTLPRRCHNNLIIFLWATWAPVTQNALTSFCFSSHPTLCRRKNSIYCIV